MKYAGIGTRKAPQLVLDEIEKRAKALAAAGYTVRSGDATGPDKWFEHYGRPNVEIFTAFDAYDNPAWYEMARKYHRRFDEQTGFVQRLLSRNTAIILGRNHDDPVDFVLCWTPNGNIVGGTGHSIRIALAHNIPVYNLGGVNDTNTLPR